MEGDNEKRQTPYSIAMAQIESATIEPYPMIRKQETTKSAFSMTIIKAQGCVRFLRSNRILTRARSLIEKIKTPPIPKNISNIRLKQAYFIQEPSIVSPNSGSFSEQFHKTPQPVQQMTYPLSLFNGVDFNAYVFEFNEISGLKMFSPIISLFWSASLTSIQNQKLLSESMLSLQSL